MKRTLPLSGIFVLALLVGCSAGSGSGGTNGGGGSGGSPSPTAGGSGGSGGSGQGNGGDGGLFGNGGGIGQGQGGGAAGECVSGPDEDKDMDGFSVNGGDCNDCDANVNPGAIEVQVTEPDMNGVVPEPADEDCNGMVDDVLGTCDDGIAYDDADPMNGARAVDLCQQAGASGQWGVMEAAYVRANGSNATPPNPLQYGIFESFGPNVNVQGGARMLGLSSGHARIPGQNGACNSLTCYSN